MDELGTTSISRYRNHTSVLLESEQIRLEMVPEIGGKIVSLIYKPTGREWMLDAGERELLRPVYGSQFGKGDMSGWDECFPSIDPSLTDADGRFRIPDHGEVWALPWGYSLTGASVNGWVNGHQLPYCLTRTLTFSAPNILRLSYAVYNHGREPLPFLWVPHPQFSVPEPMTIILPDSVKEVLCVFGGLSRTTGETYLWAKESAVSEKKTGDGRKYYVNGIHAEGWCGIMGCKSGDWLIMEVDPKRVPYLGIWIDESMFNDRNTIALEPAIGYYDSLDRACENGTVQTVQPGEKWEWSLAVEMGSGIESLSGRACGRHTLQVGL